jgi:hypothetical protein
MKNALIALLIALTTYSPALAVGPAPEALKGGKVTVTLADGKTYTFSSDEFAVVRRGTESAQVAKAEEKARESYEKGVEQGLSEQPKNILSVGLLSSQKGFETSMSPSTVDVNTKRRLGVSFQFQRRVLDDKFIGIRVDTNGGFEGNVGIGF